MLIPEPPRPREETESAPSGSSDESSGRLAVIAASGSPTVQSGSSSSARRRLAAPAGRRCHAVGLPVPGDVIDTFLLEEAIGVGGMGAVYRALDTKLDRQVALKLLPPDQATDAEVVQRFYQEGRSAARLDHENIARVFSIGQDGPFHYIAFEYIEGVTVRQRVETAGALAGQRGGPHRAPDRPRSGARLRARGRSPRHQALEYHHHAADGPSWLTWGWRAGSSAAATAA